MVALSKQQSFSEVFIRFGQVPLGGNPDAEPFLCELSFEGDEIPAHISARLNEDDVFSLAQSYGDATVGDPATFDFLRITTTSGVKTEIEVFNIAILLFVDNREETRRLFRILNTIKGEQGGVGNGLAPVPSL